MVRTDARSTSRENLFLLASIRIEQETQQHRIRVRNLSDGGMMGEGPVQIQRGNRLEIKLRNLDCIVGSVAWVQDQRFGVAFDEPINSRLAHQPIRESQV